MKCNCCETELLLIDTIFIDDDWELCKKCYEKNSIGNCEYSSYCNLTGTCDYQC